MLDIISYLMKFPQLSLLPLTIETRNSIHLPELSYTFLRKNTIEIEPHAAFWARAMSQVITIVVSMGKQRKLKEYNTTTSLINKNIKR